MGKFKKGDWVYNVKGGMKKLGYITGVMDDAGYCKMITVEGAMRGYNPFVVYGMYLKPAEVNFSNQDLDVLIDLSLQLGDKQWFKELVKRKITI
jgi:hypothetical protein